MSIEEDIALLERVPMLRRLGGPALRMLAIGGESLRVGAGEQLFRAGDTADGAYIVQQGSFRLRPERAGQNEVIAGPGTLIGEAALLS
jgi:CRP-like cAMP-binding protein